MSHHTMYDMFVKSVNISKTLRDRAISSEFLTHRVVQDPMQGGKISIFATFGGHLGFLRCYGHGATTVAIAGCF